MNTLQKLIASAGQWGGTSTLQDPHTNRPEESPSTATITPVLDGRFVRFDYTWAHVGKPQAGSISVRQIKASGVVTAHWIDSWHMSDVLMACQGTVDAAGTIDVRGSYAAPPEPDWGWRTTISFVGESSIRMVMHNIWPDGKDELAVEAIYSNG